MKLTNSSGQLKIWLILKNLIDLSRIKSSDFTLLNFKHLKCLYYNVKCSKFGMKFSIKICYVKF